METLLRIEMRTKTETFEVFEGIKQRVKRY